MWIQNVRYIRDTNNSRLGFDDYIWYSQYYCCFLKQIRGKYDERCAMDYIVTTIWIIQHKHVLDRVFHWRLLREFWKKAKIKAKGNIFKAWDHAHSFSGYYS